MAAPRPAGSDARIRSTATERRAQVIDAAVQAFAEGGYRATTTAEVARRVGVSQPYVIRLVGTKQALFLAAVEHACDQIEQAFRGAAAAAPDQSGSGRMSAMGLAFVRLVLEERALLLLLLHAFASGGDPEIGPMVRRRYGRMVELVPELTGADRPATRDFHATGMLLTVMSAMQLIGPDGRGTEPWAEELLSGMATADATGGPPGAGTAKSRPAG